MTANILIQIRKYYPQYIQKACTKTLIYRGFYNRQRIYSTLDYIIPVEFENQYDRIIAIKRDSMNTEFKQIPHTADLKLRIYGKTKEELFRNALYGMFQVIQPKVSGAEIKNNRIVPAALHIERVIDISAPDEESLLVDFLSEALYLSDAHNEAYFDAAIQEYSSHHIKAIIYGAPIEGFEGVEIKAVTYNELELVHTSHGWHTDMVFDI